MKQPQHVQQQNLILEQRDLPQVKVETTNRLASMVTHISQNTLMTCAAVMLAIITQLKRNQLPDDIKVLRQKLTDEVIGFETNAVAAGVTKATLSAARYILCAVADEFILNQQLANATTWKADADWSQQSLISIFYHDAWGGEKFFEILDNMLTEPAHNIEILELISLCLSIGFEGKYRILEHGHERLDFLQEKLFWYISQQRGEDKMILSPASRPEIVQKKAPSIGKKMFFTGVVLSIILFSCFVFVKLELLKIAAPIYQNLNITGYKNSL